jgi:hypothetical protein
MGIIYICSEIVMQYFTINLKVTFIGLFSLTSKIQYLTSNKKWQRKKTS